MLMGARSVDAFPLRVLAPTELRVIPTAHADRSAVRLDVTLRDDRGERLDGLVTLTVLRGSEMIHRVISSGARRTVTIALPTTAGVRVQARYDGDPRHAGATEEVRVDAGSPSRSLQLLTPPSADIDATRPVNLIATVRVEGGGTESPGGQVVRFSIDGVALGRALSDGAGRAALSVLPSRFTTPGIHTVAATIDEATTERRVVVRALTSLAVTATTDPLTGVVRLHGALAWRGGPVSGASVTVRDGARSIAGFVCDEQGVFRGEIQGSWPAMGNRGRVVFSPTTPWFSGCESAEFVLRTPSARTMSWRFALAAAGLGLLALATSRWRRGSSPVNAPTTLDDAITLEDGGELGPGHAKLSVIAEDRTSGAPLADALVLRADGAPHAASAPLTIGASITLRITRDGYAPRDVSFAIPRAGALRLRVGLSPWREAAYEVIRPLAAQSEPGRAPRTPREVSAQRVETRELMERAEALVYGPHAPSPEQVAALGAISRTVSRGEH